MEAVFLYDIICAKQKQATAKQTFVFVASLDDIIGAKQKEAKGMVIEDGSII